MILITSFIFFLKRQYHDHLHLLIIIFNAELFLRRSKFLSLGKEFGRWSLEWIFTFLGCRNCQSMTILECVLFFLNVLPNTLYISVHLLFLQIMQRVTKESFPIKLVHDVCVTLRKYLYSSTKPLVC